jgi:hypothetical protein
VHGEKSACVGRVLWSSHSALTHKTRVEVCQSHTLRAENGLGRPTRASQSSSAASEIQAQYETSGTHPDEKKITASDSGLRSSRPLPCKMSSRVWRPAPWVTARTSTTWRFATSLRSPRWSQHTTCSMSDHTALQVTVSPCWRTSPTPFACNSAQEQVPPSSPDQGARRQDGFLPDTAQARPSVCHLVSALALSRRGCGAAHNQALRHTAIAPTRCAAMNDTTHLHVSVALFHTCMTL